MRGVTLRPSFLHTFVERLDTIGESGVNRMKKEEKEPVAWEIKDPKPPVVRSGHMEDRKQ